MTRKTIDAVERCLSRISEAAVKLGDEAERRCPTIPWGNIRGLGNRLRHDYGGIDVARVWYIVEDSLPELKDACRKVLDELAGE